MRASLPHRRYVCSDSKSNRVGPPPDRGSIIRGTIGQSFRNAVDRSWISEPIGRSTDLGSSLGRKAKYQDPHPSFRQRQNATPSAASAYAQAAYAHEESGTRFPDEDTETQHGAAPSSCEGYLVGAAITSAGAESPLRSYGRAMSTTVVDVADQLASALPALAELQAQDGLDMEDVAAAPAPDVLEELDITGRVEAVQEHVSLIPVRPVPQLRSPPST